MSVLPGTSKNALGTAMFRYPGMLIQNGGGRAMSIGVGTYQLFLDQSLYYKIKDDPVKAEDFAKQVYEECTKQIVRDYISGTLMHANGSKYSATETYLPIGAQKELIKKANGLDAMEVPDDAINYDF